MFRTFVDFSAEISEVFAFDKRGSVIRVRFLLCNAMFFVFGHLAFRWMSVAQIILDSSSRSFLVSFSVPLSVPFFSLLFFPFPPPMFQCLSFSQHALCLCASYQHVSLSASRCLRQAFLNRKLLQLGPIYSSSIHLSLPLSPGFVLFSAAINLLANRLQSRRLGVGIMFLALRPPKNAGA